MKKTLRIILLLNLVIVFTPLAILLLRPNLIIGKAEAKKELSLPGSHFINWRGAELHYVEQGTGPTVLMIHGFGASVRNFAPLADLLQDRFHVIRVDLPGFGLSDMPALHPDYVKLYKDYITFIFDTLHLDSVYVIGNSMGGGVAWMTAADHPDKVQQLVLLNSAGYDVADITSKLTMFRLKGVGHIFDKGMPVALSRSSLEKCYANPSKLNSSFWILQNRNTNRQGNIQNMLDMARAGQFPDSSEIKEVQCPTLIIWGKEDAIIPVAHAEKFHRDIKNSRVIIYDSCGHVPMLERTVDVANDFLDFVKNGK